MNRKILLVEPNYKNKYPPMGLMKIATYHKMLGDEVRFFKGEFLDFVTENIYEELIEKLYKADCFIEWINFKDTIIQYIRKGSTTKYDELIKLSWSEEIGEILKYYRKYLNRKEYLNYPIWDRIYISTLFTFYWQKTITTINSFKQICKNIEEVKVGGIASSLMPKEIERETGISPHIGLLDRARIYDDNDIIIDHLPLDYSILDEIDYEYPENNSYYAYTTRGCINNCSFCAVPQLEPNFNSFISIKNQIQYVSDTFGEKRNLLLLDNNVLASDCFDKIIDEIKESGFYAGAKFTEPNKYAILIQDLRQKQINYRGHIKKIIELYKWIHSKTTGDVQMEIYNILNRDKLWSTDLATRESILKNDDFFSPLFEKYRNKSSKSRYVDFNQGIDARLITQEKMKKLSEISIKPLRIAFDYWDLRNIYENTVRLAANNGITDISNYLLYNYKEKPIELYMRLKMNVELCEELDISIYSFPMKYHPVQDKKYFKNRTYVGEHWNRKFIRSIQAVLNSTKGKIGRGKTFFEKAFGRNEMEYEKILYMPEVMIIYRLHYESIGMTDAWWNEFSSLPENKLNQIKNILHDNEFGNISSLSSDKDILQVLKYYTITRDDAENDIKTIMNDKSTSNK